MNLLMLISMIPMMGTSLMIFIQNSHKELQKVMTLISMSVTFLLSLFLWILFDPKTSNFQFNTTLMWFPSFNLHYSVGIDGISLFFIMLSTFLAIICIMTSWNSIKYLLKEYLICFLLLEFLLIQVFCVLDLLLFYIFFESILIPMFFMMGMWGSSTSKMSASYQFFIYTLVGSLLMLISLMFMYMDSGTTDLQFLSNYCFNESVQIWLWMSFFMSFAVKIPMIPFHLWLPEAHAEAPTSGSMILAGVLLKMGGYGFMSFSLPMFPEASMFFSPLVFTLSLMAMIYGSLTTLSQIDLKKMIAYSSMSHMGFVTLGMFSLTVQGLEGSIILMISHGLISSALFLCIGILYDSHKTSLLKYYGGLVQVMPLFTIFFFFFSFSSMGFPFTSSFMGEILVLIGISQISLFLTFFCTLGMILSASYSMWLLNSLSFSTLKLYYFKTFQDISRSEFMLLFILMLLVMWLGIFPYLFLNELHFTIANLMEQMI